MFMTGCRVFRHLITRKTTILWSLHVQNAQRGDITPPRRPSSSMAARSGHASAHSWSVEVSRDQRPQCTKNLQTLAFHLNTVVPRAGPGASQNWVMVI